MLDLDKLQALTEAQLVQCGPCDFGLVEHGCTCPKGDPRSVLSQLLPLIAEVRRLQLDNANRIPRHADLADQLRAEVRELRTQRDALAALVGKLTPPCCTHAPGPSPDASVDGPVAVSEPTAGSGVGADGTDGSETATGGPCDRHGISYCWVCHAQPEEAR